MTEDNSSFSGVNDSEPNDDVTTELLERMTSFKSLESVFNGVSHFFLCMGIICHWINLLVWKVGQFNSTHFLYYKLMTAGELIYCINGVIEASLRKIYAREDDQHVIVFTNRLAAFYTSYITSLIASGMSYWVTYLILALTIERFVAIAMPNLYRYKIKHQKPSSVLVLATLCFLAAFMVNSWSSPLEITMEKLRGTSNFTLYIITPTKLTPVLSSAVYVKEVYNATIQSLYFLALLLVTVYIICQRTCQKRRLLRYGAPQSNRQLRSNKEKAFMCLMVAVFVLEFIHKAPRELRRAIELVYPHDEMLATIFDASCDMANRQHALSMYFAGHLYLSAVGTLATQLNRACKFLLYLLFSERVRTALCYCVCKCLEYCCCQPQLPDAMVRQKPMSRSTSWSSNQIHPSGRRKGLLVTHGRIEAWLRRHSVQQQNGTGSNTWT